LFVFSAATFGSYIGVHGQEIVGNYFYAQIVSSALLFVFLYVTIFVLTGWTALLLALLATCLLIWTFLVSALVYSAGVIFYMGLNFLRMRLSGARASRGSLLQLAIALLFLGVINVNNPQLGLMKMISANNGGISPDIDLLALYKLSVALFVLNAMICYNYFKHASPSGEFIMTLSFSVLAVFAVQVLSLHIFHAGSPYALKKYTFYISTALFASISYIFDLLATRFIGRIRMVAITRASIASILALCACLWLFYTATSYDIRPFLVYENYASGIVASGYRDDISGSTISLADRLMPFAPLQRILDFSVNMIDFGMPADQAVKEFLTDSHSGAHYALVTSGGPLANQPGCDIASDQEAKAALVDYKCAMKSLSSIAYGTVVKPSTRFKPPYLREGWSSPEPNGVWSDGERAVLRIILKDGRPQSAVALKLSMYGFLTDLQHLRPWCGRKSLILLDRMASFAKM